MTHRPPLRWSLCLLMMSACSFSGDVERAAERIRNAEALLRRRVDMRPSQDADLWCSTPNIRGTQVCLHDRSFFTRVTGPFISLDGWFLAKGPDAAPDPGWPRHAEAPDRGSKITLNPGWQLYFMDD